jgi:hypothetical protein
MRNSWSPVCFRHGHRLARAALLALGIGLVPFAAGAASLTAVTLTDLSSETTAGGAEADDWDVSRSLSEDCGVSCSVFTARFAAGAGVDADDYLESLTLNVTWSWQVDVDVDAQASEAWSLTVDSSMLGALTLVSDGAGSASAALNGVLGTYTGPGTASGTLDLAGFGSLSGAAGGDSGFNAGDRLATFTITNGFGPASLSFTFTMTGQLTSTCGTFLPCLFGARGDEAALRLGDTPIVGAFTAGTYPGPGPRTQANDGHFVAFTLEEEAPEPPGLALLLGALAAVEVRRWLRAAAFARPRA